MPSIEVNGARFYYELHGQGQPLILISGYTCDHLFWEPVVASLRARFRILVFDNRGTGQTTDDVAPLTAESMADDVVGLARALGFERPYVVGQSMGGNIAQRVASMHPDLVARLVLLTSSAKWRRAVILAFRDLLRQRASGVELDQQLEMQMAWICGENFLCDPDAVRQFKDAARTATHPQSLDDQRRQLAVIERFDGVAALSDIKVPTLVGMGREDIVSLPADSHRLVSGIAGAKLVEFDCGHGIAAEVPEALARELFEFLDG